MSYKIDSVFPSGIDDLPFISDVDLSHITIADQVQKHINGNEYSKASELISQSDITPINADYFNMVQNQIFALQTYLYTTEKAKKVVYDSNEPSNPTDETHWID